MLRIARYIILMLASLSGNTFASVGADNVTRADFRSSICNIASMTVTFKLDEAFGEPLLTSKMRWSAGPNTAPDCLSRLTYIWIRARTPSDSIRYIKLSPEIMKSGEDFGPTTTESPSWTTIFCSSATDSASCESMSNAKQLFTSELRIEGFEVVTETQTLTGLAETAASSSSGGRKPTLDDDAFSLDSLLAEAVDSAIDPNPQKPSEPEEPELTPEEQAALLAQQREDLAEEALNNVVTLIASSLAQFTTPAHGCESDRTVANWVQARGTCQLNFRSEANHEFLCAEDGQPRAVRATRRANIDLEADLARIAPIRVSKEGWASVVLELNDEIRSTTEGNYKTNRWHFTAAADQVEDLKQLAGSILTLKEYCETGTSS